MTGRTYTVLVVVLLTSAAVLSATCVKMWPLIVDAHDDATLAFVDKVLHTTLGQKLTNHYHSQACTLASMGIQYYRQYESSQYERQIQVLARMIFAGAAALFVSIVSLAAFIIVSNAPRRAWSWFGVLVVLLLVIFNGTVIRFVLARCVYGNYDMESYETVTAIATTGGNVYAETPRYNYSPAWFNTLALLDKVQAHYPEMPFHFVVKNFVSAIDLVTLMFLLMIARERRIDAVKTAVLFYLNPVSFLISGYHGQFENFAVLFVVAGIFAYLKLKTRPVLGAGLLWVLSTAGLIVKHNIFYEVIICLHTVLKKWWLKVLLFVVSVGVFLALFAPYWKDGRDGIVEHVFKYSSPSGGYGITWLINVRQLKYVFIAGMVVFPFVLRGRDIVRNCLLGTLFFLAFTTGISIQYFVLPIALGALCASAGFLLYCLAAAMLILSNFNNVCLPVLFRYGYSLAGWNIVWASAVLWFVLELIRARSDRDSGPTITDVPSCR